MGWEYVKGDFLKGDPDITGWTSNEHQIVYVIREQ
jgi:hypothetical protein